MIRLLLRSYIKRFISIFLALIFIGGLSAGIFNAFLSAKEHLTNDPGRFFNDYGYIDEQISLTLDEREEYMDLYNVEGVSSIDMRLSFGVHLQKNNGKTINSRIVTYSNSENEIMKRYVVSELPRKEDEYNIAVSNKYAINNGFKVGDRIKLTLYSLSHTFYISSIVDTIEGVYPTFNPYVWTDDYDFGYVYFLESDLNAFIKEYAPKLAALIEFDTNLETVFNNFIAATNLSPIDLNNIDDNFASKIVNELIIKNAPGFSEDVMKEKVDEYFKAKGIEPINVMKGEDTASRKYMKSVNRQLGISFIFLPIFFYVIIAILVALFIGQIIRQTTRNIGIMLSNGVSRREIIYLLLSFSVIIAFIAILISIPIGCGVSTLISHSMIKTYCIPIIGNSLSIPVILISAFSLIILTTIATLIASISIFRITPKDASISNESNRKSLPLKIEKRIQKMPFIAQNATNSMLQNKRRFFISAFSICASLTMILICGFFQISKTELINQGCSRRMNYDCQIYLNSNNDEDLVNEIKNEECVTKYLDCYYSYLEVKTKNGYSQFLECLAFNPNENDGMVNIPDIKGNGYQSLLEEGIIIPKGYAKEMSVSQGDYVYINNVEVKVIGISYQYFHPITYLSKTQFSALSVDYVSSLLLNTNDEVKLSKFLSSKTSQSLLVFTSSLSKDLHRIFDTLDVFLIIMIAFSLSITLVILFVMNKNALIEQIYQLSLYRAIGFKIGTISNIFIFQHFIQFIIATVVAIPLSILSSNILFNLASSARQTYPFIFSFPVVLLALLFVIIVIAICHLFAMQKIKKIDIANNLRSSE
jgi:ABC-type antimicrobial peptide transport system permease subunit